MFAKHVEPFVDSSEVQFTSGEYTMSDKASWRVVVTLVVLFCIWLGIRYKEKSNRLAALKGQYEQMEMAHKRQEADDELYIKYGKMTRAEADAAKRQREAERDRIWNANIAYPSN